MRLKKQTKYRKMNTIFKINYGSFLKVPRNSFEHILSLRLWCALYTFTGISFTPLQGERNQFRFRQDPKHPWISGTSDLSTTDGNKQFTDRLRFVARNKYLLLGRKPPRLERQRTAEDEQETLGEAEERSRNVWGPTLLTVFPRIGPGHRQNVDLREEASRKWRRRPSLFFTLRSEKKIPTRTGRAET